MRTETLKLAALAAILAGLGAPAAAQDDATDLNDLIMYAVNNDDPNELFRFSFASEEFMVIGEVIDQQGIHPEELEAMCYIPSGDHKGFYASCNLNNENVRSVLIRIDPLTAEAYRYENQIGFGYVVGMVPVQNPLTGKWEILATHDGRTDNGSGPVEKNLITIKLSNGKGTAVMSLANRYEGLAMAADGTLFGIRRFQVDEDDPIVADLWTIDPIAGTETQIGPNMSVGKVESLEFAFGEMAAAIVTDGLVPDSWTANGVLLGFSDTQDAFLIIDPATGAKAEYVTPFIAPATDAEGLVFFVSRDDPFGAILADSHD